MLKFSLFLSVLFPNPVTILITTLCFISCLFRGFSLALSIETNFSLFLLLIFLCLCEIRRNSYLHEGVLKGYPSVGSHLYPLHVPLALVGDPNLNTCVLSCFSNVVLCVTLWTVPAHQAPQSMEFSRQEHWSGLPVPSSRGSEHKFHLPRDVLAAIVLAGGGAGGGGARVRAQCVCVFVCVCVCGWFFSAQWLSLPYWGLGWVPSCLSGSPEGRIQAGSNPCKRLLCRLPELAPHPRGEQSWSTKGLCGRSAWLAAWAVGCRCFCFC